MYSRSLKEPLRNNLYSSNSFLWVFRPTIGAAIPPPTEVKAEENVRAKSMSEYIKSHPQYALKGLRISMLGYQEQDWMENIPLFQAYEKVKVIFYRHYKTFLQNSGRCF